MYWLRHEDSVFSLLYPPKIEKPHQRRFLVVYNRTIVRFVKQVGAEWSLLLCVPAYQQHQKRSRFPPCTKDVALGSVETDAIQTGR